MLDNWEANPLVHSGVAISGFFGNTDGGGHTYLTFNAEGTWTAFGKILSNYFFSHYNIGWGEVVPPAGGRGDNGDSSAPMKA